ncbi:MAG: flagellar hook-associated protein FlgL [Clostridia bacterium]|jgi:flagellar hook-associated protein 3 FlgL|nr:flagellar hook-associated protein FlgL [Clostridia bacterium]
MRVTNRMLATTVLDNVQANLGRLQKLQDQMSSGKLVRRPSDNPMALSRIMALRTGLAEQAQHTRNMEDAIGFLDASESALAKFNDTLQRVRELTIYGASGTLSDSDRQALAKEVDQLIDELVQTGNTAYAGQFLFGGQETTVAPLERVNGAVEYRGNGSALVWEVSPDVTMEIGVTGSTIFKVSGVQSQLFDTLFRIKTTLESGTNLQDLSGTLLGEVDRHIDHILQMRAIYGAKSNRLNLAVERNGESEIKMTELLSRLEDADLAELAMNYSIAQYVYQASLATGAKVIQPSLVDYLT